MYVLNVSGTPTIVHVGYVIFPGRLESEKCCYSEDKKETISLERPKYCRKINLQIVTSLAVCYLGHLTTRKCCHEIKITHSK